MKTMNIRFCSILAGLSLVASSVFGQQITPGYTPVDGQRLTAANLLQLVNQAVINTAFYSGQVSANTNLQATDILLVLSSGGQYHKLLGSGIISNPSFITSAPISTNPPGYALFPFYDTNQQSLYQVNETNFAYSISPLLVVSNLSFAATNSGSTNTFVQDLQTYTQPLVTSSNLNPAQFLVWGTNGQPATISYAQLMPYTWTNLFSPWSVYQTNASTNAWGYYTNFPITNLFFTNSVLPTNTPSISNIVTLASSDTFPVNAASQGTNTTATLGALFQYITNQNPSVLPSYAVARVQFSGGFTSNNMALVNTIQNTFQVPNAPCNSNTPTCVSLMFLGSASVTLPSSPQLAFNTPYYAIQTATNTNWLTLYTNYATALLKTNAVQPTSAAAGGSISNVLLNCANYTAFNADAIQLTGTTNIRTATYDVVFRTGLSTINYYFTGSVRQTVDANGQWLNPSVDAVQTTNRIRIQTVYGGNDTAVASGRVSVLIQPE